MEKETRATMNEQIIAEAKEIFENAKRYYYELRETSKNTAMLRSAEKTMYDAYLHLQNMRYEDGQGTLD